MRAYLQKSLPIIVVVAVLTGCSDGIDFVEPPQPVVVVPPPPPAILSFRATVSNLTNAQPMSPAAVIVHNLDFSIFELGEPASVALESLAEGGDNTDLLASADDNVNVITSMSGQGPVPPGLNEVINFEFDETNLEDAYLSVSSMLVNTNDAITGINAVNLGNMAVGDVIIMRGPVYDAGTEADTEQGINIPGPAGSGEGFNAARDDNTTAVTMHSGVVTSDDGLITSALDGQHKFDNPAVQVSIERVD